MDTTTPNYTDDELLKLLKVLAGAGLYFLGHQGKIAIDKALEEMIPNASERAIARAIFYDDDAIKALTEIVHNM